MTKKTIYIILILTALGILIKYFYFSKKLETAKPTRGPSVEAVFASGNIESTVMYPVSPRTSGKLISILADEGQEVSENQILGKLENDHLVSKVLELEARAKYLEHELSRQDFLIKNKATSIENFQRIKSELLALKSTVEAAKTEVDYMSLKSLSPGRLIKRDGEIGQLIQANQEVFWIASGENRISAEVDEEDISKVLVGQKVLIRSDAFSGKIFNGKVQSITPKGDSTSRSYRVRITFTEDTPLLIGMTVENNIVIRETANALLVPSTSVIKDHVWILENGKTNKKKVIVGAKGAEKFEILDGLSENDTILVKIDQKLIDEAFPTNSVKTK
jgi:multidrug efflux system membrane fusion protein